MVTMAGFIQTRHQNRFFFKCLPDKDLGQAGGVLIDVTPLLITTYNYFGFFCDFFWISLDSLK